MKKIISYFLPQSLRNLIKPFYKSVLIFFGLGHKIQKIKNRKSYKLSYLGSKTCGWHFIHENNLFNSTIISAGLGQDASFDIEFAEKYNAKIIIIDPTPKAINHYKEIISSLGRKKESEYVQGGLQPISSYNLSNININQLLLIKKALWNEKTKLNFYEPQNQNDVSHSIINFQNNYSQNTKFISVNADTIFNIINELNISRKSINLIKLDIEGAEIEVLTNMIKNKFLPKQILVEFDELGRLSRKGVKRVDKVHFLLTKEGYSLIYTDGQSDFLYYKNN